MRSRVGPAVTRTFGPSRSCLPSTQTTAASHDLLRFRHPPDPRPAGSEEAGLPARRIAHRASSRRGRSRRRRDAPTCADSIAGASSMRPVVARARTSSEKVVRRARCASFARTSAVAGATTKQVGPLRELDVVTRPSRRIEEALVNRTPRQNRERERRDELPAGGREDRPATSSPRSTEPAHQIRRSCRPRCRRRPPRRLVSRPGFGIRRQDSVSSAASASSPSPSAGRTPPSGPRSQRIRFCSENSSAAIRVGFDRPRLRARTGAPHQLLGAARQKQRPFETCCRPLREASESSVTPLSKLSANPLDLLRESGRPQARAR